MNRAARDAATGLLIGIAVPSAAWADDKAAKPAKNHPDELVCEKVAMLGTRLVSKRVCMTRAKWAEQRRDDRDLLDRSQRSTCTPGAGC